MNKLRVSACALSGLLLLGGCGAAGHAPATGQLKGRLVMEGGALGPGGQQPGERPLSGTVTLTAAGKRRVSVQVGSSGAFSVPLLPGTYQILGRSPFIETTNGGSGWQEQTCSEPLSATVVAGHTTTVTVICIVP
jgi:hypothetical protein